MGSHRNTIEDNEAAPMWSDGNECDGIALYRSDGNKVIANTVANNQPNGSWCRKTAAATWSPAMSPSRTLTTAWTSITGRRP
ncbi:MAG: hypothetical protein ACRDV9_15250 [Acidimicrobiia bacterium]